MVLLVSHPFGIRCLTGHGGAGTVSSLDKTVLRLAGAAADLEKIESESYLDLIQDCIKENSWHMSGLITPIKGRKKNGNDE
jgi:hypothetical protein